MPRIDTPDWVQDAIFYQIFPDRFASSPAVVKPSRLEPWEASPTLHGFKCDRYHTYDPYQVDQVVRGTRAGEVAGA